MISAIFLSVLCVSLNFLCHLIFWWFATTIFPCHPSVVPCRTCSSISLCRTCSSVIMSPCRTCSIVKATTGTGAEPVEPFSFMGADAARLMGAKAARSVTSLLMCPIAPDELNAAIYGGVSASPPPPRRVASAVRRASIASWACIFSASNSVCLSSALLTHGSASLRIYVSMRCLHFSE